MKSAADLPPTQVIGYQIRLIEVQDKVHFTPDSRNSPTPKPIISLINPNSVKWPLKATRNWNETNFLLLQRRQRLKGNWHRYVTSLGTWKRAKSTDQKIASIGLTSEKSLKVQLKKPIWVMVNRERKFSVKCGFCNWQLKIITLIFLSLNLTKGYSIFLLNVS